MKQILFIAILVMGCLSGSFAEAQTKVAAVVTSVTVGAPGANAVSLQIEVVENGANQTTVTASFSVNFLSSTNQMNADIKARVRNILEEYQVFVNVNDIVLFGGPS